MLSIEHIETMTHSQLQAELESRRLPCEGAKDQLAKALLEAIEDDLLNSTDATDIDLDDIDEAELLGETPVVRVPKRHAVEPVEAESPPQKKAKIEEVVDSSDINVKQPDTVAPEAAVAPEKTIAIKPIAPVKVEPKKIAVRRPIEAPKPVQKRVVVQAPPPAPITIRSKQPKNLSPEDVLRMRAERFGTAKPPAPRQRIHGRLTRTFDSGRLQPAAAPQKRSTVFNRIEAPAPLQSSVATQKMLKRAQRFGIAADLKTGRRMSC